MAFANILHNYLGWVRNLNIRHIDFDYILECIWKIFMPVQWCVIGIHSWAFHELGLWYYSANKTPSSNIYDTNAGAVTVVTNAPKRFLDTKNKNQQRAITAKIWCKELWFLCTALLLLQIYLPVKFHDNNFNIFWVMVRTKIHYKKNKRQ